MAKKYKVIGQKNLAQRIPNSNIFESNTSTSLFDMGTFKLTTNLMPASIIGYESRLVTKRTLVSLEDLRITSLEHAKNVSDISSKLTLNKDKTNLNSYAYFGSLKELLRVSINNIITNWPGSLYIDPSFSDPTQAFTTVINYSYNQVTNQASFDINVSLINNKFGINFNTSITDVATSNLVTNFNEYEITYKSKKYPITSFSGTSSATPSKISVTVTGDIFVDRTLPSTAILTRTFHINPNEGQFSVFYAKLSDLERYLLNQQSQTPYEAIFRFPGEDEDGNIEFFDIPAAWPVSDGYNVDMQGPRFDIYSNSLMGLGQSYDEFKTNLIIRQLIPNSYLQLDYTSSKKGEKLLALYGRQFDEIKAFIDGLAHINTVNYGKIDNAPDAVVYNLAKTLGWDVFPFVEEEDLLNSIFGTATTTSDSKSFTPTEINIELWRRIIINTGWLLRSKGTRQAIEAIFSMIGAPDSLIELNEHIYLADKVVKIGNTTRNTLQFDSFESDYVNQSISYAYPQNTAGVAFESTFENEFVNSFQSQGFSLKRVVDNKKSWANEDNVTRVAIELETAYPQGEQQTVINSKQMSMTLNVAKALNYSGYEMAINTPEFSGLTFMQFLAELNNHIPATSRKTIINQYVTLSSLYQSYLLAYPAIALTQPQLIHIIKKIDGAWARLLYQMLPATTILNERGVTIANTVFTPQKFAYKRGVDAGSNHATKQPERIEDFIYVASIETGVDEEIKTEINPIVIVAEVFNSGNGNINQGGGLSILTDRIRMTSHVKGINKNYSNLKMESVNGASAFSSDMSLQNNDSPYSTVYRLDQNSSKKIDLLYLSNQGYNDIAQNTESIFGYLIYEITQNAGAYQLINLNRSYIPSNSLDIDHRAATLSINNSLLNTDSQYIISPFYMVPVDAPSPTYVRTLPLDYNDNYALNKYPLEFSANLKFYDRSISYPNSIISTEKKITTDTDLSKLVISGKDFGFLTISNPDKPELRMRGITANPIIFYNQNVVFIKNGVTEIVLDYEPIGVVTATLNGTVLDNTQFLKSTNYTDLTNNVVYAITVVTTISDSLIISYNTANKPVFLNRDSLQVSSTGLTNTNTILLNGVSYVTMELSEVPVLSSVKVKLDTIIFAPIGLVPGSIKTIYFPYSQAIIPNSIISASYLKQLTNTNDYITVTTPLGFSINWVIANTLPDNANGEFRIEFASATSAGIAIVPDFTNILYSTPIPYVAQGASFNKIMNFTMIPELSSFEYLYFRVTSKKNVVAFGSGGTFSEKTIGNPYMLRIPGAIVSIGVSYNAE